MALRSDIAGLKAPSSVMKIAGFLADIRARQQLVGPVDIGAVWDQHDISVNHVDGFLGWLHIDRFVMPPKDAEVDKRPEQSFVKPKAEPEDKTTQVLVEELSSDAGDREIQREVESLSEEAIREEKLWRTIVKPEKKKSRREAAERNGIAVGDRAGQFAHGYNRNFLLANLALTLASSPAARTHSGIGSPGLPYLPGMILPAAGEATPLQALADSEEVIRPVYITQGLATQAFGQAVADRADGGGPVWNEPVRRDISGVLSAPTFALKDAAFGSADPVADPLYAQITLVAPPIQVSLNVGQGAAAALTFDWKDMAKGADEVDFPTLATLAKTLPQGTQVLYPAIDPRKLRGGAVNLRLEPRVAQGLVAKGYGTPERINARQSARMAADYYGGTPPVGLLPGTLTPLARPGRRGVGMSPDELPQGNTVGPAEDPSRRMRFIDYLGLPIYLSPQFNTSPDLEQETRARVTTEFMPRAPLMSPQSFANLRRNLLGGFYGVEARPELGVWRQASPDYERAGSSISGLLSNRLRMGGMGDGVSSPLAAVPRSAALPAVGAMGRALGPAALPKVPGSAVAARAPLQVSPFTPPSMPPPAVGNIAQSDVPRFIRHQPRATAPVSNFRPTIPAMSQMETAPAAQGATAPKPFSPGGDIHIRPQITVSPEKPSSRAPSAPAKQSAASPTPVSQPPMEGPKPTRPSLSPQPITPRPISPPQVMAKPKMDSVKTERSMGPEPSSVAPTSTLRPPQMLIAPHKPVQGPSSEPGSLAVQTSTSTPTGTTTDSGTGRAAEVAEKREQGLPGSEINLLANEVWILLKRRLSDEAQRMGR